jgi:hypothetical protein
MYPRELADIVTSVSFLPCSMTLLSNISYKRVKYTKLDRNWLETFCLVGEFSVRVDQTILNFDISPGSKRSKRSHRLVLLAGRRPIHLAPTVEYSAALQMRLPRPDHDVVVIAGDICQDQRVLRRAATRPA